MKLSNVKEGVYRYKGEYYTLNMHPGTTHHGENIISDGGKEYRHWEPYRSKLGAFLKKCGTLPIHPGMDLLYLGAGDGTTVSYLSDIIRSGRIFGVEFSRRPFRHLLELSKKRNNIYPILADARDVSNYEDMVPPVDFIYQDIAQREQSDIFVKNIQFLDVGCKGILAIKSRSIDVTRRPSEIYNEVEKHLISSDLNVLKRVDIGAWQKDHALFVIKK